MKRPGVNTPGDREGLKREFAARGLDIMQVWQPSPDDPGLEGRQLRSLLDWVEAYQGCPDRAKLEEQGYDVPPVYPDVDPETDWLRFESWVQGRPLGWRFDREYGTPADAGHMTESELAEALDFIAERLAEHGVVIDILNEEVPARLWYSYLRKELRETEFEHLGPGTHCVLSGCDGYCPGCFQRPWCADGGELSWPDDEEVGFMVVPEETRAFVSPSPVSLRVLQGVDELWEAER